MFKQLLLLALTLQVTSALLGVGWKQSVGAMGSVVCKGQPERGVQVKLKDNDKTMAEMKADASGTFRISGRSKGITNIDPAISIRHKCSRTVPLGWRHAKIKIPKEYITQGEAAEKFFNAGVIDLVNY